MSEPAVSVVMPVRNGESYLAEAMDSILNQTLSDFEFIVVDNCSNDRTPEILREYEKKDRRIQVYEQDLDLVEGRNLGCKVAAAELIAIMDADDVAFPNRLERQVRFLERKPEIALIGGGVVITDGQGVPHGEIRYPVENRLIREALFDGPSFTHATIVMRRDAFLAVGGYRKPFRYAGDYDLLLRIAERFDMANLYDPVLYHRVHLEQITVRHRKQQAVLSLVAKKASEVRRQNGHDPLLQVEELTPAVLDELSIGDEAILECLVASLLWSAATLSQASYGVPALELLDEAIALSRTGRVQKELMANLHWTQARALRMQGRLPESVTQALKGCLYKPTLAAEEIVRKLRRRISPV